MGGKKYKGLFDSRECPVFVTHNNVSIFSLSLFQNIVQEIMKTSELYLSNQRGLSHCSGYPDSLKAQFAISYCHVLNRLHSPLTYPIPGSGFRAVLLMLC